MDLPLSAWLGISLVLALALAVLITWAIHRWNHATWAEWPCRLHATECPRVYRIELRGRSSDSPVACKEGIPASDLVGYDWLLWIRREGREGHRARIDTVTSDSDGNVTAMLVLGENTVLQKAYTKYTVATVWRKPYPATTTTVELV